MLKRLIDASLHNRFLVLMAALVTVVAGLVAAVKLPIDAVPDVTNRQIQINTLVPSLSPQEVEAQVTFAIETAIAGTPGLVSTRSLSRNGFSQVTAVFRDSTDIYFARQLLTERLAVAREVLPAGVEPRLGPVATGLGEVYWFTLSFGSKPPSTQAGATGWQPDGSYLTPDGDVLTTRLELATYLRTLEDWTIKPRLLTVEGVAGVDSIGGFERQLEVQPDPERMIAYGITLEEITAALEGTNTGIGVGYIEHKGASYITRADSRFRSPADVSRAVVATRGSTPVTIGDLARVVYGKELRSGSASANGEEVVLGVALMRIGANSRTVAAGVAARLKEIAAGLPPGIELTTILDRTRLVNSTIRTVTSNLAEGALLVIAVLFLTIGNFRAAIITALVIPLSMLITAVGMVEAGVSANLMSLGALDFGLIVDGAIIIVENSLRRLGEQRQHLGHPLSFDERRDVVASATHEMVRPSVYGQIIICIVYVPVLMLTGVEGKMFQPMAVTVIFALVAAFGLSLTVIPALVLTVITGQHSEKGSRLLLAAGQFYNPLLDAVFRRTGRTLAIVGVVMGASLLVFLSLGHEFIPTLDEFDIAAEVRKAAGTNLTQATTMQRAVELAAAAVPEVAFAVSRTGTAELATDPMPPNSSDVYIILKPRSQWPDPGKPKSVVLNSVQAALQRVPGINFELSQPIQLRFNELLAGVKSDVGIKVFGDDTATLRDVADEIGEVITSVDGIVDVKVEQTSGQPVVTVSPDRDAVARYGVKVSDIHQTVVAAVIGRICGQIYEGTLRYPLVLRFPEAFRASPAALERLPVPLPATSTSAPQLFGAAWNGAQPKTRFLPLASVAHFETADAANQVSRENGRRRVVVTANIRGRDLGSTVADARQKIASQVKLPPGVWIEWGGQIENLQSARARLAILVPLCAVGILALLYGAVRSLRQAAIIFTGVPFALTGGVLALWLVGLPFSISAAVGFIALSGVAVLNGLVLASAINRFAAGGMSMADAARQGAIQRLRPVLMTGLVASIGFVPMALATGAGAEVQKPLAWVVIGGLITSTALTLVVLPSLYRRLVPLPA